MPALTTNYRANLLNACTGLPAKRSLTKPSLLPSQRKLRFNTDASLNNRQAGIAVICSDPRFSVWGKVPVCQPGNSVDVELAALDRLCYKLFHTYEEAEGASVKIYCDCDSVVEKINEARQMSPAMRSSRKWLGGSRAKLLRVVDLIEQCESKKLIIKLERARATDPGLKLAHRMARAAAGCSSKVFNPRVVPEDDYLRCQLQLPDMSPLDQEMQKQ